MGCTTFYLDLMNKSLSYKTGSLNGSTYAVTFSWMYKWKRCLSNGKWIMTEALISVRRLLIEINTVYTIETGIVKTLNSILDYIFGSFCPIIYGKNCSKHSEKLTDLCGNQKNRVVAID